MNLTNEELWKQLIQVREDNLWLRASCHKLRLQYESTWDYKISYLFKKYMPLIHFYFISLIQKYQLWCQQIYCKKYGHNLETINEVTFCTRKGCSYSEFYQEQFSRRGYL